MPEIAVYPAFEAPPQVKPLFEIKGSSIINFEVENHHIHVCFQTLSSFLKKDWKDKKNLKQLILWWVIS